MPKQNIIATNFTSGEVSPLVRGRVDAQKYANGLETCENFIVRPQGPIWRRSGTRLVKKTKKPTKDSILVPFEYSDLKGYVLEFGEKYIHIYYNGEPLFETTTSELEDFDTYYGVNGMMGLDCGSDIDLPGFGNLSVYTLADVGTVTFSNQGGLFKLTTSVPHTLRTGCKIKVYAYEYGVGYGNIDLAQFTITVIDEYSFTLNGSTYSTPNPSPSGTPTRLFFTNGVIVGDRVFISGAPEYPEMSEQGHFVTNVVDYKKFEINVPHRAVATITGEEAWTIPIEIVTPYTEAQLRELRFVQSSDVLYIMHPDVPVHKLTRLSNDGDRNDWFFTEVDFKDGPYLPVQSLAPEIDESNPQNGTRFPDVYFELSNYSHTATLKTKRISCNITANVAGNTHLVTTTEPHGLAAAATNGVNVQISASSVTAFNGVYGTYTYLTPTTFTVFLVGTFANATATFSAVVANDTLNQGRYVEYREGDQWRLAFFDATITPGSDVSVTVPDNVLLHLDESVKYTNKITRTSVRVTTYNSSGPNETPSVPGAGKRARIDPNNSLIESSASKIDANFANTFGTADVGKWIRYFSDATPPVRSWALIQKINHNTAGKTCTIGTAAGSSDFNTNYKLFEIVDHVRTATLKSYSGGTIVSVFKSTDVGRHVRIGWGGRWVWGKITAYTSGSQVSVSLYEDVPRDPHNARNLAGSTNEIMNASSTTGKSYDWRLGAWSDTTGYPSCGTFHEQRLWFGRTSTEPQSIWGSVSGDFENFSPTELDSAVLEDNAINFTIASTKANPIKWMVSGPAITVGTTGGEWQVKSSSVSSEPITPLNIVVVPHTSHGSSGVVQPIRIGSSILFSDRPGNKVRELIYDFSVDGLVSRDITYLSEHILRDGSGAIYSAYQQEPNNICWYVLSDGTLAAVTINKDQEIVAWHRHVIQGGNVKSIAVVPSEDSSTDDLYLTVEREGQRYVEVLNQDFMPVNAQDKSGMRFFDSSVNRILHSGATVGGLNHLATKTVGVLIDGVYKGTTTVNASGYITVEVHVNKTVSVGLLYSSTAKSLPPEGGSSFGVSQGKIKKLTKYNVRLLNSLALDYGFNANSQALNSLTNLHENGTSTDFYTGTKELIPNNPYDAESQWTLSTSQPYPLNILSVTLTVETGE
jgi:hypothetical protein